MQTRTGTRRRVVVDQRELARAIGGRIRNARHAAGMTQQELAGDRYTKAYISALELGHAKPSMAALDYLAPRLGTTPDQLVADPAERWSRLDADLHFAAGRFTEAAQAYLDLAGDAVDPVVRGEMLLGAGESYGMLRRPAEAAGPLAEATHLLANGGRVADRRRAQYWMAHVHASLDDPQEAIRLLKDLLTTDAREAEDAVFEVRIRIALAQIEIEHGSVERAQLYLEEAKDLTPELDLRRRGIYLDAVAKARFASGDIEGAIRAGVEARTLLHAAEADTLEAGLENELAMSFLALGNLARAEELALGAIAAMERLEQWGPMGHCLDTEASICLARGDAARAVEFAERALALEARHGPPFDQVGARITRAHALAAMGRIDEAIDAWAEAGDAARHLSSPARRRRIFTAWAEALAAQGRHAQAYGVMREAL